MKKEDPVELALEMPEPDAMAKFLAAARASGLHDEACTMCTRPFITREKSRLCPPCRMGKPDGWTPAHTMRKLRTGSCLRDSEQIDCSSCQGLGVSGWQPGAPASPICPSCRGSGQVEPIASS